jgi:hypothetical protein
MRKSGPGVLGKVRAEKNVLVGYHPALLSERKCLKSLSALKCLKSKD